MPNPESIWMAAIAVLSPLVVGAAKALLDTRKVRTDASLASFTAVEKRNEFLSAEVDRLRSELGSVANAAQTKYDALQEKYYTEREKVVRLESKAALRTLIRDESVKELPFHAESELDFMEPFQAVVDAVVFCNVDGILIGANAKALLVFGYVGDNPAGKKLEILIPERYRNAHREGMKRVVSGEPSRISGRMLPMFGLHKDGWEFPIELTVTPFEFAGKKYFAGVIRVIDEHRPAPALPLPPTVPRLT